MYSISLSHVNINNQLVKKSEPYKILDLDLSGITMRELYDLFNQLFGVPSNFSEYLIKKINEYDKSENVNSFYYNGNTYWFDKNTRLGLMNLLSCGGDSIQVLLGDQIITFNADKFKLFLLNLEIYASLCYITTNQHILAAKNLQNFEEIANYDYTEGYPDKITLTNE